MNKMLIRTAGVTMLAAAALAAGSVAAYAGSDAPKAPSIGAGDHKRFCDNGALHYEGAKFSGVSNDGTHGSWLIDVIGDNSPVSYDATFSYGSSTATVRWYCP